MSSALYAESCGSGEERFGRRGREGGREGVGVGGGWWGGGGGLSGLDVGTLGGADVSLVDWLGPGGAVMLGSDRFAVGQGDDSERIDVGFC